MMNVKFEQLDAQVGVEIAHFLRDGGIDIQK